MKHTYLPLSRVLAICVVLLITVCSKGAAQTLTSIDSMWAPQIPPITVPALYRGPAAPPLPFLVDNSLHPYFRPIYNQAALECGQAAGVAYTYTYEINRLRNLPANTASNQYPTHWVWNFSNNGVNSGISFFESWDIIHRLGTPNVQEWGGTPYFGGQYRWISGYNTYYNAMKNRLDGIYAINLSDTAGISIMKHWLHDHLDGSAYGGVAAFYAEYTSNPSPVPAGVYGAGKHVIPAWGGSPNHAMTIVGYDDSIRWDYNSDGQYTNHLDINGDGYVTLADWEIGAFKLANSYGGVPAWGDNGFCYFMYQTLARPLGQGGIWNQTAYVMNAVHDYSPLLAMKVKIKYPSRENLKISVGVSLDTMLFTPQYTVDFPAFRFQGGNRFMQGGTTEADKTIEIGLDLTPLLSYITPGIAAAYFVVVEERDANNAYNGEIISMSVMDYSGATPLEKACQYTNVPILNNMRTEVPVTHAISFQPPAILDTVLPPVVVSADYEYQLSAAQGQAPYSWDIQHKYTITASNQSFPGSGGQNLNIPSDGRTMVVLPFQFPFYGNWYDTLWVYVDGYITFDDELHPWPYLTDETSYMRATRCIAPYMYKGFTNYSSSSDGAWMTVQPDGVLIRWNTSQNGQASASDAQFAVKLCPDGSMHFYYGSVNFTWQLLPVAGFSAGNSDDFVTLPIQGVLPVPNGSHYLVQPAHCQSNMLLSKSGKLSLPGTTLVADCPISIRLTDRRGIRSVRDFHLNQKGVTASLSYLAGGDSILHAGELAELQLRLTNIGDSALGNLQCRLFLLSNNALLIDSLESIASILPDSSVARVNAFRIRLDSLLQDRELLLMKLRIVQGNDTFNFHFEVEARAARLGIGKVSIADGNDNLLAPGETAALIAEIRNEGGLDIQQLRCRLFTWNPYIQILSDSVSFSLIPVDTSLSAFFIIHCSASTPAGQLIVFRLEVEAANGVVDTLHFFLIVGDQVETFESNDFSLFPWQFSGNSPWIIDSSSVFQGQYCARSATILDNQTSELFIKLDVLNDDVIGFMRKVDCEPDNTNHNYDYLLFSIDGVEQARWDGNKGWEYYSFPVSKGFHTFKWSYRKDYSVSTGQDRAWLDNINLPVFGVVPPLGTADPVPDVHLVLHAFPNPGDGRFELMINSPNPGIISIQVCDLWGREIYAERLMNEAAGSVISQHLDVTGNCASGMYFILVRDSGGLEKLEKVIIR